MYNIGIFLLNDVVYFNSQATFPQLRSHFIKTPHSFLLKMPGKSEKRATSEFLIAKYKWVISKLPKRTCFLTQKEGQRAGNNIYLTWWLWERNSLRYVIFPAKCCHGIDAPWMLIPFLSLSLMLSLLFLWNDNHKVFINKHAPSKLLILGQSIIFLCSHRLKNKNKTEFLKGHMKVHFPVSSLVNGMWPQWSSG